VLTFTTGDGVTGIDVQVDAAADGVFPDFDSGTVTATAGVLDLAATAYAGLADGSTTYWRARAQSSLGWSGWSAWVSFSRNDLDAVTLTDPTATPADVTPPFVWSFAGAQTAWQATLLAADGKQLDDSGIVAGAATSWTPLHGLTATGQSGTARVRVWDDVVRIATPGEPTYSEDTADFTVDFDGTVDPLDTLTFTQTAGSPGIELAGTRAAGIPDEVAIFRDDVQVARLPGPDVFPTSTTFAYTDWSAPMKVETEYRVAPVVNGAIAAGGPTVTVTPSCAGLWLADPSTDTAAVLGGTDEGSWSADDAATVHQALSGASGVVRRRLRRGVLVGSISGSVLTSRGFDGDDTLAAFEAFAENDAGNEYRLIVGHLNAAVIAGDFLVTPTPTSDTDLIAKAQFNFWGV
jgi:hypothetical protein